MQKRVILIPLRHRSKECIGIYFDFNKMLQQRVKGAGAAWSKTYRAWYMKLNKANFEKIKTVFDGYASLDYAALKIYLHQKKNEGSTHYPVHLPVHENKSALIVSTKQIEKKPGNEKRQIHAVNAHVLPAMEQYLVLKAYSKSTLHTYLGEMRQLLLALKNIPADDLKPDHLKKYMVFCLEKFTPLDQKKIDVLLRLCIAK